jgi:hypothetical protein
MVDIARCPALNRTSQGKGAESGRVSLGEAIELYLETRGIPKTH